MPEPRTGRFGIVAVGDSGTLRTLEAALAGEPRVALLATVGSIEALAHATERADVLVLDGALLKDGTLDAVGAADRLRPGARIVVLMPTAGPGLAAEYCSAGADACLTHEEAADDLASVVCLVATGRRLLPAELADAPSRPAPAAGPRIARAGPVPAGGTVLSSRLEVAVLAGIVLLGLVLRLAWLGTLPDGMHGDEASVGLEAERILREGYIGPFSPLALGMPSGPMYLDALAVALLGHTVVAVRLAPALLSGLAVLAFYALLRRAYGAPTALLGAGLAATMTWLIHFGRLAIPNGSWSSVVVLAVAALFEALARRNWRWWALAGGVAALGLYVYQAHSMFLAVLGAFIFALMVLRWRRLTRQDLQCLLAYGIAFLLVALPMLTLIATPSGYTTVFSSFPLVSVLTKPEWLGLETGQQRALFLLDRYVGFWRGLTLHPIPNSIDGSGTTPLVPAPLLLLAGWGMLAGLLRRRVPLTFLALMLVLVLPFGSVLTVEGPARRTNALAPFLALFAALGVAELVRLARQSDRWTFRATVAGLAVVLAVIGYQSLDNYFVRFRDSSARRFVFADEYTQATRLMQALPPDRYVYFYSERWSFNYEIRRYLAPEVRGEDQSTQFGGRGLPPETVKGRPVFLLFGSYQALLPDLQARFPGGVTRVFGEPGNPSFVAYEPAGAG